MIGEIPSHTTYDEIEESKEELDPEAQEVVALYSSAREENDPERQLELLRQIESKLHDLLEPRVASPFPLSDQDLRSVMLHGVGYFLLGVGHRASVSDLKTNVSTLGLKVSMGSRNGCAIRKQIQLAKRCMSVSLKFLEVTVLILLQR